MSRYYYLYLCCFFLQEEKFMKTNQLSERIKLWDRYTGPVDHHTVKVNFFKRVHRQNPPFKYKIKHRRKMMIKVRRAQYKTCQILVMVAQYCLLFICADWY